MSVNERATKLVIHAEGKMTRGIGIGCMIMAAIGMLAAQASGKQLSAMQVASKIQAFYVRTNDFQAGFRQEYFSKALGRKRSSTGFVYIKKPGMMRWDYKTPRAKHFVVDGKALYVYDPDLMQVMRDKSFSGSRLTGAVNFLWGKGNLGKEFVITFSKRKDLGGPDRYVLQLVPRKKARFKKLIFVVDAKTYSVSETIVEDPGGNVNHVFFDHVSTNVGLKDSSFHFDIPAGVDVIDIPHGEGAIR
jgi:outer membrane lipoprotein carrier protein